MEHDDFDDILQKRKFEMSSGNLADRIVMAAARMPQEQNLPIWKRLRSGFMDSFLIPRPALALSICLLIGVMAGTEAEFFNMLLQDDWSSFLYADEVWL